MSKTIDPDPVGVLRSDIEALRSIVRHLDYLAEDYRDDDHTWKYLKGAAHYAGYALADLRKLLPQEKAQK